MIAVYFASVVVFVLALAVVCSAVFTVGYAIYAWYESKWTPHRAVGVVIAAFIAAGLSIAVVSTIFSWWDHTPSVFGGEPR